MLGQLCSIQLRNSNKKMDRKKDKNKQKQLDEPSTQQPQPPLPLCLTSSLQPFEAPAESIQLFFFSQLK